MLFANTLILFINKMLENKLSPIVVFVYNRPEHTRRTIQALLKNPEAEMSDLFVFSDAAKDKSAEEAVKQVREYIRQISGFKTVTIYERDSNWGLANSVIDGVTHICNDLGKVIVLEDDLQVSPHFLAYMNEGLDKYEHDERVMQIAGYMFPAEIQSKDDALFLPFISSWGWATWSRAWKIFDPDSNNYQFLKKDPKMIREFNLRGNYNYFKMLKSQLDGETNSWAIRWYLSVFFSNGLVLYPKQTLVENIGFDGTGENCIVSNIQVKRFDNSFHVVNYPSLIQVSIHLEDVFKVLPKPKPSLRSVISYIKRLLK